MNRFLSALFGAALIAAPTVSAQAATQGFNLQLVNFCEGVTPCPAPGIDTGFLQSIYDQIGIVVNVLSTIVNNADILERDANGQVIPATIVNGDVVGGALDTLEEGYRNASGFGFNVAPNTVYMGFTGDLTAPTLGIAFLDAPFRPFGVVENYAPLFDDTDRGRRFTTAVLAHEVGHVLGGDHAAADLATDLMQPSISVADYASATFIPTFSAANATTIQQSQLLFPVASVPLPASLPALLAGVVLLFGLRRRGRAGLAAAA